MEIIPGIYQIPGVMANTYLIAEAEGLTLIDAGLSRSARRILSFIQSVGRLPEELRRILVTHADGDHVGGVKRLLQVTSATAATSRTEADAWAEGRMSRPLNVKGPMKWLTALTSPFFRVAPVKDILVLEPGETLPILGGLRVLSTPGHTPGHISFFAPSQNILFAGDSMRSTSRGLTPSRGVNTWDEALAQESLHQQAALAPEIVCVGHGPVVKDATTRFTVT